MMSEWISVKDRLPQDGEMVLVCTPSWRYPVTAGERRGTTWALVSNIGTINDIEYGFTPDHWMPFPEPPEPRLTTKEALREALDHLSLFSNRECGGTQWTQVEIAKACGRLPRLRSVLESEE